MPSRETDQPGTGLEEFIATAAGPPGSERGVTAREQILLVAASDAGRKEETKAGTTAGPAGSTVASGAAPPKARVASFWRFG